MTISNIYLFCQNIAVDTIFNVYKIERDYAFGRDPEYSGIYEHMDSELSEATVIKFYINDIDGDIVDVLIY